LPLILYPTRAIRRKNVGELLLLAATNPGFRFATTLSPKNKQWAPIHNAWAALAKELRLPVQLALGEQPGQSYASLIKQAHAMVTTSVGEGFGLAFLEPWLFGKPVTGRDLPEVTDDFKSNGIQLPDLYTQWQIPSTLFDVDGFRSRLGDCLQSIYTAYGRSLTEDSFRKLWQHMSNDGTLDFACLDETAQAEALRKVCREKPGRIQSPVDLENLNHSITSTNANKISEVYGLDNYKTQLLQIYRNLLKASPAEPGSIRAGDVLDAFLDPARLRMLRS
jgi:glycosyltransferase involved in cell wall biosynthesis